MQQNNYSSNFINKKIEKKNQLLSKNKLLEIDHRIFGKKLNLYHFQNESPGMVFWHNNGYIIFHELEKFLRIKLKKYNYQEVKTPLITDSVIWKNTGHWKIYKKAIFSTSSENRKYCIKPMNCPGHIQIFQHGFKSYKDLPLRIAEFGICHRNEPSGSLHGLMRLRSFTQDDAHIFCTQDQVSIEIENCIHMMYEIYQIFGFKNFLVKLSTRPKNRIGNNEIWDESEKNLAMVLKKLDITFNYQIGDGAFYGPKIEFSFFDCLNREWQCGTIQLDFALPSCLNLFYMDSENKRKTPVIIHRAILGSIERFIGILLEEYSGYLPIWLAPLQIIIINISNKHINYAMNLLEIIKQNNIRVQTDLKNEKIAFKIRKYTIQHIPYILICGDKEIKNNTVSIRDCFGKDLGNMKIRDIISKVKKEINNYNIHQLGR
ncbi:threonine--tRNA ligase [Enterobacteriaceae endosymbiont of Plateumaris consimilis]|uniref:threonine--tRNA ligase n=1 Tax=Enterobacteriaceae endosymbiont of Plateumaris consimilis TaxID=2675794 RepID=UPI00144916C8|nr:threonine--tRNA ligase [Enterobacteriaceae endosymbiont of Plateumaris consimilis]QJC28520.1 threonine--tRNA ligase [Enterobacteriaceae endosymbiont of Plateumaris consimilis]